MTLEELKLVDRGNVAPSVDELVSVEVLGFLNGLNKTLGSPTDKRFSEYQNFLNTIDQTAIIKIDPASISDGKFDNLNLTGKEDENNDNLEELGYNFNNNDAIVNFYAKMMFLTPIDECGLTLDKEFMPFVNWQTPHGIFND
jgi:hypothetical protein